MYPRGLKEASFTLVAAQELHLLPGTLPGALSRNVPRNGVGGISESRRWRCPRRTGSTPNTYRERKTEITKKELWNHYFSFSEFVQSCVSAHTARCEAVAEGPTSLAIPPWPVLLVVVVPLHYIRGCLNALKIEIAQQQHSHSYSRSEGSGRGDK